METIFIIGLSLLVTYFGLVPLKAGAEYRFRGKTGLLIEGLTFLAIAVVGILTWTWVWPAIGAAAGIGIRQIKGNDQRYLE